MQVVTAVTEESCKNHHHQSIYFFSSNKCFVLLWHPFCNQSQGVGVVRKWVVGLSELWQQKMAVNKGKLCQLKLHQQCDCQFRQAGERQEKQT